MEFRYSLFATCVVLTCASVCTGIYLMMDYYLDNDWPPEFGQACEASLEDDALYLNSHLNSLGILNYGSDIDCTMQLDAGKQLGARYKLDFKRFDLEHSINCTADYLEFYDTEYGNVSSDTFIGRYCGDSNPEIDCYPTQRFMVIKFKTDWSVGGKGFRIKATRTLPAPCLERYFHCKAENRCIDERLHCDGTPQCDDESDEEDCSFLEKFIGALFALGVSGLVGVGFLIICVCTGIGVTICACTCCKKCCRRCCCKCCRGSKVGDSCEDSPVSQVTKEGLSTTEEPVPTDNL